MSVRVRPPAPLNRLVLPASILHRSSSRSSLYRQPMPARCTSSSNPNSSGTSEGLVFDLSTTLLSAGTSSIRSRPTSRSTRKLRRANAVANYHQRFFNPVSITSLRLSSVFTARLEIRFGVNFILLTALTATSYNAESPKTGVTEITFPFSFIKTRNSTVFGPSAVVALDTFLGGPQSNEPGTLRFDERLTSFPLAVASFGQSPPAVCI